MKRADLLKSSEYWITKIQIALYDCAEKFMTKTGKNRTQLAEHLGVSKGYVSQVLHGDYDHRLSKFVELTLSFGYVPRIEFVPVEQVITEDTRSYVGIMTTESSISDFQKVISEPYGEIKTAA